MVLCSYAAHHGPVRALQRNPQFPKNFLTAGDRSMKACIYSIYNIYINIYPKIWSEDITRPLAWVWSGEHRVTAASWSPARPSVVFAAREDGVLMVMDILYHHQPVVQVAIPILLLLTIDH